MEWECDRKAAPGECVVASASRRPRATPLARLEPPRTSASLSPARATPTPGREPVTPDHRETTHRRCGPHTEPARALTPLLARAACSQCASASFWTRHDHVVRYPSRLCHLARFRVLTVIYFYGLRRIIAGDVEAVVR